MTGGLATAMGRGQQDPRLARAVKRDTDRREILQILEGYRTNDGVIDEREMKQGYALLISKGYTTEARQFLQDAKSMVDMDRLKASAEKDRMGPGTGKPQKGRTYMLEDGSQLKGVTVFQGGSEYIQKANGERVPIPDNAKEITPGMLKNSMLSQDKFLEIKKDIIKDNQSIKRLSSYADSVKGSGGGLKLLVNQFTSAFKTAGGKPLTPEEIATMVQKGDINALLGKYRKEVVGGGVMTEPDAKRVLLALGGDVSMWRNPEVVGIQLKKLFQDKIDFIKNNIEDYNNQLNFPGRKGSKIKVPVFDMKPFDNLTKIDPQKKKTKKVKMFINKFVNGRWQSTLNPAYKVGGP
tara:strand:- start:4958 stop:6010 length:1053 start_codon:yes stop_codon:yes gene_type:complete